MFKNMTKGIILQKMIDWRRSLHKIPEISFQENKTSAYIRKNLEEADISVIPIENSTGLLALLKGSSNSKITLGFRAELDGLPIEELTTSTYKSEHKGISHVCGHDVHMAILLGLAHLWKTLEEKPEVNVLLIFQPAEEKPPGGAKEIIASLEFKRYKPDWIFALHVHPFLKTGTLSVKEGITMAAYDLFEMIISGQGGHAAAPQHTNDPIVTSSFIIQALQSIISRQTSPTDSAVISIGEITSYGEYNIIPERVCLKGTFRTLSKRLREEIPLRMENIASAVGNGFGCQVEYKKIIGYPPLVNDEKALEIIYEAEPDLEILDTALMAGDDFAYYLEEIPGAYIFLGCSHKQRKMYPWHSPNFTVNEDCMLHGLVFLTKIIKHFQSKSKSINGLL